MQIFDYKNHTNQQILALGPESNGNFSVFSAGKIYFSEDFGDLLLDVNFSRFKKELNIFLKKERIKPDVILTDLHPLYKTTLLGEELGKKFKVQHIQIQHHIAHICSQIFNLQFTIFNKFSKSNLQIPNYFYGIALDGTGYGLDGKIWGGECFAISNFQFTIYNKFSNLNEKNSKQKIKIERIGHLEDQVMIGGDLAIREPARMLISILSKFLSKEKTYAQIKKYYSVQEFEVLYNQLQQNFNCIETSSAGRVLDAVSLLLGFCNNERKEKHEATYLLEKNSTRPYLDLKPKIDIIDNSLISNSQFSPPAGGFNEFSMIQFPKNEHILNTTYLFEYLIKNIHKDKRRLAATVQLYIAQGLNEIIEKNIPNTKYKIQNTFLAGGIANNKIIGNYFESKNIYTNNKVPRGDAGLSFGQIIFYLTNPRD